MLRRGHLSFLGCGYPSTYPSVLAIMFHAIFIQIQPHRNKRQPKLKFMKLTRTAAIILLAASLSLQSCAVMFQGSKKEVTVKSMTPGASIWINGNKAGEDAVTQRLARKTDHMILVKKDGCETKQIDVKKKTQVGWVVFDALFNWLAFATDAPTGAWNTFHQSDFTVELNCPKSSAKN